MTEAVVRKIDLFQQVLSLDVEIRFTGGTIQQMKDWLGDRFVYTDQGDGDLGCRLTRGIKDSFLQGYNKVIVIGSDCPSITVADLKRSLDLLDDYDCVLGPAFDGGYYLIGLRVFHLSLFSDITWSSPLVLQQTIEKLKQLNLTWAELRPLGDIDRPEDLVLWLQYRLKTQDLPKLSVIIPTLNEEDHIHSTLLSLQDQPVEVIVVDGGSQDKTIEIVRSFPFKVLVTEPHRAKQMNMGAKIATGDILLFLHGDTKVPPDFVSQIITNLAKPDVVAGAFLLGIDDRKWDLRLVEWGVNLRSKLLELPYGDQGIFLSKQMFNQVGGFPEIGIMEDFILIKQLQKLGKIAIANTPVRTSPRRWQKLGVIKTTLVNQLVILGYYLGVQPDRLRDWYRSVK